MISALLLMLSSATSLPRAGVCQSLANVAQAAALARDRGVTEAQALAVADELQNQDARATARTILWYVYEGNADNRVSPAKLGSLIRGACMASTPNALTQN